MAHDLADLSGQLVAVESVNPDLDSGGSGEAAAADLVAGWLRDAGLKVSVTEVRPGRPNVVGVARGSGGGRSLLLNGHLDTVGLAGMEAPLEPRVENGRLYGRGSYDMKASVAAMVVAGARAKQLDLRGDVIVTAVCDEEVGSIGSAAVAGAYAADAAIVTEPTELAVAIAHRGFVAFEVEVEGRAAHGSRPDLGIDAIAKTGRILVGIEELDERLRAAPSDALLASGSLHAGLIEGGQEFSSYPDRCLLRGERRTIPGETEATTRAELEMILADARAADPALSAESRFPFSREPFRVDEQAEIVQLVRRKATNVIGSPPEIVGVPFWTDAAIFAAAGIPTVLFGPIGAGAHAVEEWVDLESVERCADTLTAVAEEFCA